jgi:hypothetical protein
MANVKQKTIEPFMKDTIVPGTLVYTDEYSIYARGSYWIPRSWMRRGHPTQWLSFFPPLSLYFSRAFNREVCFSDHDGA